MLRRLISKTTWVYFLILIGMIIYVLNDMSLAYHQFDLYDTSDPRTVFYWHVYHTTTDMTKALLAIGLFLNINYGRVVDKLLSAVVAAWFVILGSILLISDYAFLVGLVDAGEFLIPNDSLFKFWFPIAVILAAIVSRAIYGVAKFKTIPISKGNLYLVKAKPSGLFQCATLALTGAGAWFSITDGEHIWEYDEKVSKLVKKPFDKGYLNGKGVELICPTDPVKTHYLNMRVGDPYSNFSTDRNCIGFLKLSDRWQEEHNE